MKNTIRVQIIDWCSGQCGEIWYDVVEITETSEGKIYYILKGNEGGHDIIHQYHEEFVNVGLFDVISEIKKRESILLEENKHLRRRQDRSEYINAVRTQISKLKFEGRPYASAMLEYDLNNGLI